MPNFRAAIVLIAVLAACSRTGADSTAAASLPDGACKVTGNSAAKQFCRTTAIQLLANPELYDGRLVLVGGWVISGDGQAFMYLTSDLLHSGDSSGSLILLDGPALKELVSVVGTTTLDNPARLLSIGGRFHLNRQGPDGKYSLREATGRFGSLREVSEVRL